MTAETIESAAAEADVAPLDLLFADAALGVLTRAAPGCGWRRWPPRLVAGRTRNLLGELARIE
jgi:hypothetical protein